MAEGRTAGRLMKAVERRAIQSADGIVVSDGPGQGPALRRRLAQAGLGDPCVALMWSGFEADAEARAAKRAELGLGSATVMAYVGKFGGW